VWDEGVGVGSGSSCSIAGAGSTWLSATNHEIR
jgi:hypothetical protein